MDGNENVNTYEVTCENDGSYNPTWPTCKRSTKR